MNSIILITLLVFGCSSSLLTVAALTTFGKYHGENALSSTEQIREQIKFLETTPRIQTQQVTSEKQENVDMCGENSNCVNEEDNSQIRTFHPVSGITYTHGQYTYHNIRISHLGEEPEFCLRNTNGDLECSTLPLPSNCAESSLINCWKNKCRIRNHFYGRESFLVPCEFEGGWTVIQRRLSNSVDFDRNWLDYKNGFGDLDGNYWIGLDKLYALEISMVSGPSMAPVELYIRLIDFNNVETYSLCQFSIQNEKSSYAINHFHSCWGSARTFFGMGYNYNFSTKDQNNEDSAESKNGGWWKHIDTVGGRNNLNGKYYRENEYPSNDDSPGGIYLRDDHNNIFAFKYVEMLIRPMKV